MTTCRDLTKNEADLKKIGELLVALQTNDTPTSLLFPWFPSPARKAGKRATTELFTMLYTYVEVRRQAELTSDAIDVLIAEGETTHKIVGVSPVLSVVRDCVKADVFFQVYHDSAFRWYH
jgi:sterol 14-demethylase